MEVSQLTLEVLNPQGETAEHIHHEIATRVTDLNGKTIGILCNWVTGHEVVFENIRKALNSRFKDLKFIEWRSEANAPLDEKGLAEVTGPAKQCDAVVGFVGF